ncbi:MAG: hypothetical protein AAGM22_02680 [Acidobacteriota bacterium]
MKMRVWLPLVLVALLWVPTVAADDAIDVPNPIEIVVSWVTSIWTDIEATIRGPEGPEAPSPAANEEFPGEEEDSQPGIGPWVEPHG